MIMVANIIFSTVHFHNTAAYYRMNIPRFTRRNFHKIWKNPPNEMSQIKSKFHDNPTKNSSQNKS